MIRDCPLTRDNIISIRRDGYVLLKGIKFEELVCSLSDHVVRDPVSKNLVDIIVTGGLKRVSNLSFGRRFGDLPLHTDYPDQKIPPKYIALSINSAEMNVQTVLVDFEKLHSDAASRSYAQQISSIRCVPHSRSCSLRSFHILDRSLGRKILRYAPNCMSPLFSTHRELFDSIGYIDSLHKRSMMKYILEVDDIIVIDNWRVLHGSRLKPGSAEEGSRIVRRLLLKDLPTTDI